MESTELRSSAFLGEILRASREACIPCERARGRCFVQRSARRGSTSSICSCTATSPTRPTIAQALADECGLPLLSTHRRRRASRRALADAAADRASRSRTRSWSPPRTTTRVYVRRAPIRSTPTALDDVRALFGKPVEATRRDRARASSTRSTASTSATTRRRRARERRRARRRGGRSATSSTPTTRRRSSAGSTRSSSRRCKERASDIHIEPGEKEVVVRYRIDGELYVAKRAPQAVHERRSSRA